jgi:hypothetical protein
MGDRWLQQCINIKLSAKLGKSMRKTLHITLLKATMKSSVSGWHNRFKEGHKHVKLMKELYIWQHPLTHSRTNKKLRVWMMTKKLNTEMEIVKKTVT